MKKLVKFKKNKEVTEDMYGVLIVEICDRTTNLSCDKKNLKKKSKL